MKLQSQVSRIVGEAQYKKFWVVIPIEIIKKLGWKMGQDLKPEIKGDKLVIEKQ